MGIIDTQIKWIHLKYTNSHTCAVYLLLLSFCVLSVCIFVCSMPSFIFTHAFIKKKSAGAEARGKKKKKLSSPRLLLCCRESPPFVLVDLFATKTTIRRSHYCSYVVITQSLLARNMFHCEASYNTPNWQGAQERVMHVSDSR